MSDLALTREPAAVPSPLDVTAYCDLMLTVACPACRRGTGAWCTGPDGRCAVKLHAAQEATIDAAFVEQHGASATSEPPEARRWLIDLQGRARD